MRSRTTPSNRDEVSFGNNIVDSNRHVGKRVAVCRVKGLEPLWSVQIRSETMNDGVSRKHFVDGRYAALVPDLIKPPAKQCFVFARHRFLLLRLVRSPYGSGF